MGNKTKTYISIGKVGLIKAIAKLLAFLKTVLIARFFGASGLTDAWYVAYTIPEMLINFLGFQDLKGATTAIFSHYSENNPKELSKAFSAIFNLLMLVGILVSVIAVLFAGFLVNITAHGLDSELLRLAAELARIVLPVIIFLGISNYLMSFLNALEYYSIPAIVQLLANLVAVLMIFFFHDSFGIKSIAWGILLGWIAAFIVQMPILLFAKIRYRPFYFGKFDAIKKFILLFSPLFIPIFASQINALVIKNLGSTLRPFGKITAYSYAILIVGSLISVAVEPFTIVLLPRFSRFSAKGDYSSLSKTLKRYSNYFMIIFLPISIFMIFSAGQIVDVIFQRGAFDEYAHKITTLALIAGSIGILPWAMNLYYKIYFLAVRNTKIIATIDVITIFMHIGLNFILTKYFDLFGLVLAASIAYFARFIIYGIAIGNKIEKFKFYKRAFYLVKLLPAGAVVLLICLYLDKLVTFSGEYHSLINLLISAIFGFGLYFIVLLIMKNKEMSKISQSIIKKKN